ncbi:acyl-CoA-binding domain-containing protein 6-like [Diaphorina citri]|uniref:Acyl-CoA-binding domain-containing protein 6 n=1 Tax=Diaphorina citri TaxID=121845 RepID=A0A1S3CX78_DIACI|nr:acyl-CoA-binding domain-containing protein 6-like [Diaphorina citri]
MAENMEDRFNQACDYLPSLVKKLDSSTLLKFYALYKQATVGQCNIDKPSWYNMEAKSKYNAWNSLGQMAKSEAMSKYIALLNEVDAGWEDKEQEEINWDESQESGSKENEGQTKGWVNVSSMINDESQLDDNEKNIYEWAKEGKLDMLVKQLTKLKDFNINQLDENGLNCLHWACDRGHLKVVQHLIEKCGADVNVTDSDGDYGLDYAKAIEHTDLIEYLVNSGAHSSNT